MGSRGRMLFDLNELPAEVEEAAAAVVPKESAAVVPKESAAVVPQEAVVVALQEAAVVVSQPQKSLRVPTTYAPTLFQRGEGSQSQGILNNNAFKHASIGSGFQPFVRNSKDSNNTKEPMKVEDNHNSSIASLSMVNNQITDSAASKVETCNKVSQAIEREEGEWSDADGISENAGSSNKDEFTGTASTNLKKESQESEPHLIKSGDVTKDDTAAECSDAEKVDASEDRVHGSTGSDNMQNSECKGNQPGDDLDLCNRSRDVKGVEANYALRFASNPAKRPKLNEHKEAMLGKKRARQTVFINVEDAKQAGTMKTSTPRRQSSFPAPIVTRTVKEASRGAGEKAAEKQSQQAIRDQRQPEMMGSERSNSADPSDQYTESNGDAELGTQGRSKKMNAEDPASDGYQQPVQRQASFKQSMDLKQPKSRSFSSQRTFLTGTNNADQKPASKRSIISKKQTFVNNVQDSSVERLIREVTNDKFWHNPEEAELECVPGSFESAEEYIRVFEPLLFEECRAQLYSSYEESLEAVGRDAHVAVRVKTVDRRERGWYDVVVLPIHEQKWNFKEGDVAILSFPRPGSAAQSGRSSRRAMGSNEDAVSECGRLVGTVRRHMPIDTRDPIGAIIHFYLGDSFDSNRYAKFCNI
ncbi:P-loop containing nucleoside triphosphate hydrolase superfamily protein [Zea mays]|uniref:p-loop containing nucleoside triphosphate hydrolase superfamily protein n=1 Tax=Zea mays TaxID=4577 RepID=A0A1D6GSJ8_MAIZE|nr:P-loop containing nucleoside triphosphate hydrolase superfamily protein [Zea mays]AQK65974.1 P-loop containing nucleoside triphosphate hydrolase superfamily protein [Zea mays]